MSNQKSVFNVEKWGDDEVRIELFGNGNYIQLDQIEKFVKENYKRIAIEIKVNAGKAKFAENKSKLSQ